jgi:hypothetical protein
MILDHTKGIIVQQVNLRGVMGTGVALAIRNKWPKVYKLYMAAIDSGRFRLGKIQMIQVDPDLWICNLAGQERYGYGECFTDYDAYKTALPKLRAWAQEHGLTVYIPDHIGCVNGGGDWAILEPIIREHLPEAVIDQQ